LASVRLLLVDDDETVRLVLQGILEANDFEVVVAPGVPEALWLIATQTFDVVLSDLHMPGPGDGLTVVSAMRHINPAAVTILLSANPDLTKATDALLRQADEVLLKPLSGSSLVETIRQRLANPGTPAQPLVGESVADVLEQQTEAITQSWLDRIAAGTLAAGNLSVEERCEHLPFALRDVIFRLRYPQPLGTSSLFSMAAQQHGARRRRQGLGAATLIEEARALQIALFDTIETHRNRIDHGPLPAALMTIADEINSQLLQALEGYENEQPVDVPWRTGLIDPW
jgi:CheY-like chemotaxis protein